jgi:hypothetical protein
MSVPRFRREAEVGEFARAIVRRGLRPREEGETEGRKEGRKEGRRDGKKEGTYVGRKK